MVLPDMYRGRHFGAICAVADELGVEHVKVIREQDSVELVITAELPEGVGIPVRASSTAFFEPAMLLVAELPLGLDEPLLVHVNALRELAEVDIRDGSRLDELRRHWYGTTSPAPIEQDLAAELDALPADAGLDEHAVDGLGDTAMLTVSAEAVTAAVGGAWIPLDPVLDTARHDMAAELDERDEVFLTELSTVAASTGGESR
ncbi:hypothetical protein NLX83_39715 [Allokutzneria sp. A3M-2-11 16]|uniref:hypothetical protein n=1 Tax=Allokutzneria sp. A3M-2-11 16 TaxID=2962043 RepID=UPI0020B8800E|nr:hypothetical protein [Allokutzneria sp. A3M-2-11 16]MCP3805413.1 hypothetical protein [Allokutzneria sp. A3M-2-11 16]